MTSLDDLRAANNAFATDAAHLDPDAAVATELWPTATRMIDHLGTVQAWVAEVVRTGAQVDRRDFKRPDGRDQVDWFTETGAALVATLEKTDPDRPCWTIFGAPRVTSFWRRRMVNEAAKHLWDLRTAVERTPRMPVEISLDGQAGVIDEFAEVLVPAARARGIERLPRDILLVAENIDRHWRITRQWEMTAHTKTPEDADADILRADVGDLVLFIWERASPWELPDRYRVEDAGGALRAFSRTPVHL